MTAAGKRRAFVASCLVGFLAFSALGAWQLQRLGWKRALIARVETRLAEAPVDLEVADAQFDPAADEYRRVRLVGRFDHDRETLVEALTERGAGAWVLTPLQTPSGFVLVNRGFVPADRKSAASRSAGQAEGEVVVTGLLRATEPEGRILRRNDPAHERWFSRDVQAIALARQLPAVPRFFVDADATPNAGGLPIGGLTVIRFRNAHLAYALTWFALAGLGVAGVVLLRRERPT